MKGSGSDQDGPRPGGCRAVEIKDTLNRSTWTPHARNGRMPASASVVDGTTVDDGCRLVLHPVAGRLASRDLFRAALTARHTNGDGGAVSASPRQSTAAGLFGEGVFGGGGGSGRVETGHDTRRRQAPAWLPAIVAAGTRAPAVIRSEGTGCACAAPPLFALPEIVSFGEARPGCRAFSPECPSSVSDRGLTCTGGPWPSWPAVLHAPDRVVRLPESLRGLHLRRHTGRSCPWDTLNKSSLRSHPQSRARPSTRLVQSIPCGMVRRMVSPTTRNGLLEN